MLGTLTMEVLMIGLIGAAVQASPCMQRCVRNMSPEPEAKHCTDYRPSTTDFFSRFLNENETSVNYYRYHRLLRISSYSILQ